MEAVAMMWGGPMMGWMWIWPTLVIAGLAILGFLAIRLATGGSPMGRTPAHGSAREILDERYARGEIDEEEYRRRKSMLP
jgi:putative membrane protein